MDRSIENPEVFLNTNIKGTAILMDACRKYGIERYHQVSTDEVYGNLPLDMLDLFFTEDTPIHTSSPYSSSKVAADLMVLAYHRTYGLPVTISRCSNNYGPHHFPEKLILLMIVNALNDKPLPVYGEGLNVCDWLYVKDHCKAIDLILHKGKVGEVYNVGGHNEKQNIGIVKIICKQLEELYMKFFVTGVGGQLEHDVMNELAKRGYEGVGSDIQPEYGGVADGSLVVVMLYVQLDITDKEAVKKVISEEELDAVIHCAAWTAVDMAEDDDKVEKVRAINAGGTQNIVDICKTLNCKMTYISTDYVFDDQGTEPWRPECKDYKPLNVYGETKLEGNLQLVLH